MYAAYINEAFEVQTEYSIKQLFHVQHEMLIKILVFNQHRLMINAIKHKPLFLSWFSLKAPDCSIPLFDYGSFEIQMKVSSSAKRDPWYLSDTNLLYALLFFGFQEAKTEAKLSVAKANPIVHIEYHAKCKLLLD